MDVSSKIDLQLLLLVGMLGMFMLSGAIIIFIILYQKRLYRNKLQLHQLKAEHQLALLYNNIETTEIERKRIARDLHDDIGNLFATLHLYLNQLKLSGSTFSETAAPLLEESSTLISQGMDQIRQISHDLLPPGLTLFGLVPTLKDLCHKINAEDFSINFVATPIQTLLPEQVSLSIYRIVQELLNNTMKHAKATKVFIHLENELEKKLTLKYEDDGIGLSNAGEMSKGLGLSNMENRANMIGGHIHFASQNHQGFTAILEIPLNKISE